MGETLPGSEGQARESSLELGKQLCENSINFQRMGGFVQASRILLASFALVVGVSSTWARVAAVQTGTPQSPVQQTVPDPAAASPVSQPAAASAPIAYDQQPLPQDPAAALELASKANGLASDELKPWHLKAHYQTYDPKGKPAAQGTFEMFWAAKDRYRISYTGAAFTQSSYVTPAGSFRTGSEAAVPYPVSMIWGELLEPLSWLKEGAPPTLRPRKSSGVPLTCFDSRPGDSPFLDEYCFDEGKPILRSKLTDGCGTLYNRIGIFQHRFVAMSLRLKEDDDAVLDVDVDQLGGMKPADAQALVPPGDATRDTSRASSSGAINVSARVIAGHILHKEPPSYPSYAKQRRVQGSVRLAATIGKDGLVHDLQLVHDPDSELSRAAMDAVSKWRYQPYLLDGEPVEVHTTIRVTFTLSGSFGVQPSRLH